MLPTDSNDFFKFSSSRGWQIYRKIITDRLPFGPHDYQLEGIAQALDGQDVVAVSATGSGKSAYIYMLAVVLLELAKNPKLSPVQKKFHEDPAIVVVCPTMALEDDLVRVIYMESNLLNFNFTGRKDTRSVLIYGVRCRLKGQTRKCCLENHSGCHRNFH